MTFWDFLDKNQEWALLVFAVVYSLLSCIEGLKNKHEKKNPKWEKIE